MLGPISLTSLVIANMMGAGVFTTSGFTLATLGSSELVMWAWLCGGVLAVCGAICYGSLSRRFTKCGGEYMFLSRVVNPMAGFVAGWVSLLAGFTGATALAAMTFETYLAISTPEWIPEGSMAIALVLLVAASHASRLNTGVFTQNIAVVLKLGSIIAFIVYCFTIAEPQAITTAPVEIPFSLYSFAGSLVWISFSYSGFNVAIYVSGEALDPARNVPRTMLWGTVLVTILYLGLNAVFIMLPAYADVAGREDVAAAAAESIGGPFLGNLIRGVIALALATSVSSMIMAAPRVYAQMADDGWFPQVFRFQGEVPRAAIFLQAGITVIVILFTDLKEMLSYLGLTLSLCAAFTVSSLFILRRREGKQAVPIPGYPLIPIVYVGGTLFLTVLAAFHSPKELLGALVTILSGCLLFLWIQRQKPSDALEVGVHIDILSSERRQIKKETYENMKNN